MIPFSFGFFGCNCIALQFSTLRGIRHHKPAPMYTGKRTLLEETSANEVELLNLHWNQPASYYSGQIFNRLSLIPFELRIHAISCISKNYDKSGRRIFYLNVEMSVGKKIFVTFYFKAFVLKIRSSNFFFYHALCFNF